MDKTISFSSKVTASDSVLIREWEGGAVLLNLDNESCYSLDEVGTHMWAVLTTSPSIAAAHAALLEKYDVAPDKLESAMRVLIGQMVDNGLLVLT